MVWLQVCKCANVDHYCDCRGWYPGTFDFTTLSFSNLISLQWGGISYISLASLWSVIAKEVIKSLNGFLCCNRVKNLESAEIHCTLSLCQVQFSIRANKAWYLDEKIFCSAKCICANYKMYLCKLQNVFVQIRLKHYYPKCRAFCARLTRRGIWLENPLHLSKHLKFKPRLTRQ